MLPDCPVGNLELVIQRSSARQCLSLLVPVERIELPTFGLQNRCSTAELNRLTRNLLNSRLQKASPCPATDAAGQAGRQIPELSCKGYRRIAAWVRGMSPCLLI